MPLLEARALPAGSVQSMEATEKPARKLKETRTFNPRKMRPKRCADCQCAATSGQWDGPFSAFKLVLNVWGRSASCTGNKNSARKHSSCFSKGWCNSGAPCREAHLRTSWA